VGVRFLSGFLSTGTVTIDVNGTGAKNLKDSQGNSFIANCLQVGQLVEAYYDGTDWLTTHPRYMPFTDFSGDVDTSSQPASQTFTSVTVVYARYQVIGDQVTYELEMNGTVGGTADNELRVAGFPVSFRTTGNQNGPAVITDNGTTEIGRWEVHAPTELDFRNADNTNWGAGTAVLYFNGSFETITA